jgi:hypothetical protein|tara:strand:+ start:382 stop:507 length:126 start_codon:yes stop_codon:yes gene_type:complete
MVEVEDETHQEVRRVQQASEVQRVLEKNQASLRRQGFEAYG